MALPTGGRGAEKSLISPYFGASFIVKKSSYAFGQAASWTLDDKVLSGQLDSAGVSQIYRANVNGSNQHCLTCDTVQGPSAFPQERPQAGWIMFESYGQSNLFIPGRPASAATAVISTSCTKTVSTPTA